MATPTVPTTGPATNEPRVSRLSLVYYWYALTFVLSVGVAVCESDCWWSTEEIREAEVSLISICEPLYLYGLNKWPGSRGMYVHVHTHTHTCSRRKTVAYVERKNISFGIGGGDSASMWDVFTPHTHAHTVYTCNHGLHRSCSFTLFYSSFLPKIRAVLKSVHLELYQSCEVITTDYDNIYTQYFWLFHVSFQEYYKTKGARPPTRPNDIHDGFEGCMDALINKSQGYRSQAEEYRNNCIEGWSGKLFLKSTSNKNALCRRFHWSVQLNFITDRTHTYLYNYDCSWICLASYYRSDPILYHWFL